METKFHKLKNGIKVVIVPILGLKSVTVEVFFKIGAKYELRSEAGMSHFLEHMAFKGTKKRPQASVINEEIDGKGASYNAGTGHEMTSYYITTTKENVSWAVEILSDILINSIFESKEVLKERGVIKEEIRMYQDNPIYGLSGEMIKFMYGGSPIGCWNIAGEVEDIETVDRKKVVAFRNKFINTNDLVVVLAGNVDDRMFDEVKNYFEAMKTEKYSDLPGIKMVLNQEKEKKIKRELEQGHFVMALPGLSWTDKRRYAFKILDIILNGNSSSRLYQKIREDKGLAYYVFSISESFKEGGFWGVQSGVKLDKIEEAMEIVEREIKTLSGSLKEEELSRAKDYLIGKTKLAMDKSDYWSNFVGSKLLLEGKMANLEEEIKKYTKVSLAEAKDLAKEIFRPEEIRRIYIRR